MAITFQAYATNNPCYQAAQKMPVGSPAGIIVHSTGANNPNLKRYVNAPEICGINENKNYYDREMSGCPHAVIGLDKYGDVRAAKLLPWNICCWGCSSGKNGSYNYKPAYIQFEICEDNLESEAYFNECFDLAAKLCARLMHNYPTIKLENVISHKEAHARGYANNHADCDHWLAKHNKNMEWFRNKVADYMSTYATKYNVLAVKTVDENELETVKKKLELLGFVYTIEMHI